MNLLLDTHIWFWALTDWGRLSDRAQRALRTESNALWFSPVSLWEFHTAVQKGRLELRLPLAEWFAESQAKVPLQEAPFTSRVALELSQVDLPHRDPADRFLVATARVYDLTLVTADEQVLQGKSCKLLPGG